MKKKIVMTGILAAALLIPTGAFAAYSYLADGIYGSKEALIQAGGTEQQYEKLETKLERAKQVLNEQEFTEFMSLNKQLAEYNTRIADVQGTVHPERLTKEEQQNYDQLQKKLEPYFEKLSGAKEAGPSAEAGDLILDMDLAKKELSSEEYAEFESKLAKLEEYVEAVSDQKSSGHLSAAEQEEYRQLEQSLQPYFDRFVKPMKAAE
ncbi:DUF3600 domain-containing protein [Paenibacillus terreus]|uniref:DUF3600 domain-containing protein n=1 Tax=Paenibacillus terreus TaxID=1387834 RepID=A0ABV5B6L5_9BACL